MAFGMGVHYCLGAMLARMELRVALEQVLRRMGEVRIETTGKPISHEHKMLIRALTSLPISFTRLH
jgi:cytochrome P450